MMPFYPTAWNVVKETAMSTTATDIWEKATHVHCMVCDYHMELPVHLDSEGDIDDLYDELECCDDPAFEVVIVSDIPLGIDKVDDADFLQPTTVGMFGKAAFPGKYVYPVNDVLVLGEIQ